MWHAPRCEIRDASVGVGSDEDFYWPSRRSHELIAAAFDRKRREEEEAVAEVEQQRREEELAAAAAAAERQRREERVADALEAIRDKLAETETETEPQPELDAPSRQGRKLSRETKRKLMRRLRQRKKNPRDHSQRAIAEDLGISPTTVQRYWAKMSDS
jgi:Winged helix-turn-helix DNA-binding